MAHRARLAVAVEWVVVDDAMGERTVVACSVRFVLCGCGCVDRMDVTWLGVCE